MYPISGLSGGSYNHLCNRLKFCHCILATIHRQHVTILHTPHDLPIDDDFNLQFTDEWGFNPILEMIIDRLHLGHLTMSNITHSRAGKIRPFSQSRRADSVVSAAWDQSMSRVFRWLNAVGLLVEKGSFALHAILACIRRNWWNYSQTFERPKHWKNQKVFMAGGVDTDNCSDPLWPVRDQTNIKWKLEH